MEYLDYKIVATDIVNNRAIIEITKQKYSHMNIPGAKSICAIILFKSRGYKFATWGYADYSAFNNDKIFYLMGESMETEHRRFSIPVELLPIFKLMVIEYNVYMNVRKTHEIS